MGSDFKMQGSGKLCGENVVQMLSADSHPSPL